MMKKDELLLKCVLELSEHYDTVQIITSNLEPNGSTDLYYRGSGNWYARKGSVSEFLTIQDEDTRKSVQPYILECLDDEEDED